MQLRLATADDIAAMHVVRMAVRENRLSDPASITPEDYRAMLEEHGRGWLCDVEGKVAGFAIGDHSRRNIWALFVQPGFEGRGIGRRLHDVMVRWLFAQGDAPLWLGTEPGTRAERFYARAGWERRGPTAHGELRFELPRLPDPDVDSGTLTIGVEDDPSQDDILVVDAGLDEFNACAAPLTRVRQLAAFARDASGRIVGGAVGRTWGQCCELLQLWVDAPYREHGVGSRLMNDFEARARARGCSVFYLTTLTPGSDPKLHQTGARG